ncbi:hypothetical protein ACT29H_09285 [Thermophagus sp. OGC60D27]|uniref:hypothetical protein n=1 Tax=Thermophagus sp. OGC60D27 TaxID=3458415 RepID=UPI0040381676
MTKKELKKLRNELPRGYGRILSEITGKHFNAVYRALKGETNSPEIIQAAINLAKQEKEKKAKIQKQIKSL